MPGSMYQLSHVLLTMVILSYDCFLFMFTEPVEEVIAEDYDDRHEPSYPSAAAHEVDGTPYSDDHQQDDKFDDLNESDELVHHSSLCPNCSNPYHTCTDYCRKRWGYKQFKADPLAARGRDHLLKHYPLPPGWLEVGDAETWVLLRLLLHLRCLFSNLCVACNINFYRHSGSL